MKKADLWLKIKSTQKKIRDINKEVEMYEMDLFKKLLPKFKKDELKSIYEEEIIELYLTEQCLEEAKKKHSLFHGKVLE